MGTSRLSNRRLWVHRAKILHAGISPAISPVTNFDEVLNKVGDDEDYMPDFILYVGGTLVSKRLKKFLRLAVKKGGEGMAGQTDGDYIDTFMRIDRIFQCDTTQLADAMTSYDQVYRDEVNAYKERWEKALWAAKRHAFDYEPSFSSMAAVKAFPGGISGSFAG